MCGFFDFLLISGSAALPRSLLVLHCENSRTLGHGVLCAAEEPAPVDFPARLPSHGDGAVVLLLSEVRLRGAGRRDRIHELLRSRHHVLVLSAGRPGTADEKVLVVEEVPDRAAAGAVLHDDCRAGSHLHHGLQSAKASDHHSELPRRELPLPVLALLHQVVPDQAKATEPAAGGTAGQELHRH